MLFLSGRKEKEKRKEMRKKERKEGKENLWCAYKIRSYPLLNPEIYIAIVESS